MATSWGAGELLRKFPVVAWCGRRATCSSSTTPNGTLGLFRTSGAMGEDPWASASCLARISGIEFNGEPVPGGDVYIPCFCNKAVEGFRLMSRATSLWRWSMSSGTTTRRSYATARS